jgi:hypothetical protein
MSVGRRWFNPIVSEGTWILLAVLLGATGFGLWRSMRDGRFRDGPATTQAATSQGAPGLAAPGPVTPGPAVPGQDAPGSAASDQAAEAQPVSAPGATSVLEGLPADGLRGERATLLQFSSAFCAPCRATRGVLADVASAVPGVAHVELDAEHHLELVRRLRVTRTPTTLLLDRQGRETSRAAGAPRRDEVLATLARSGL